MREVVRGGAAVELVDADVERDGVAVGSLRGEVISGGVAVAVELVDVGVWVHKIVHGLFKLELLLWLRGLLAVVYQEEA